MIWENDMKLSHRREFLHLAASAAALPLVSQSALAQAYPNRPVRLIVGFAAGGVVDVFARLIGQWLSERLGQQFVVENRTGAAGNLATEAVAKAPADGYTLLQMVNVQAINATLYEKLTFNFLADIAPVASSYRGSSSVVVVNPNFPVKTIPELIAYAKANPGKVTMASAGIGSGQHIYGELFKMLAGVDLLHVPYRSAPQALTDLIGGQVQIIFDPLANVLENVKAGKLRALAVTSVKRSALLPNVPSVSEFVRGYEASGWQGIGAPKNTPAAVITRLNREINAGLADPKIMARFAELGYEPYTTTPAEFSKFVADETEKWGRVIRTANIKAE
jgi:tripartite-type tricarboxylate transporter receptor subunit TctC